MRASSLFLALLLIACDGEPIEPPSQPCHDGTAGCACYVKGTCDANLECVEGVCVVGSGGGDPRRGDPVPGDPWLGDPVAGDPSVGDSVAGDTTAGDPLPECGNGVAESGEDCDGDDHRLEDCDSLGYLGGALACVGCRFDVSACGADPSECGDGIKTGFEQCDGETYACADVNLGNGSGACPCSIQ